MSVSIGRNWLLGGVNESQRPSSQFPPWRQVPRVLTLTTKPGPVAPQFDQNHSRTKSHEKNNPWQLRISMSHTRAKPPKAIWKTLHKPSRLMRLRGKRGAGTRARTDTPISTKQLESLAQRSSWYVISVEPFKQKNEKHLPSSRKTNTSKMYF